MSDKIPGDGTGCIITGGELQDKLLEISNRDHRWTALPVYCGSGRNRKQVHAIRIWYTNPGVPEMPNMICYELPAFPRRNLGRSRRSTDLSAPIPDHPGDGGPLLGRG